MSVPNYNYLTFKEYDKISKYKDQEIEKMCHLKTTIVPVIRGALTMIKKRTDKHINKMHFMELLISLGEY